MNEALPEKIFDKATPSFKTRLGEVVSVDNNLLDAIKRLQGEIAIRRTVHH